MLLRRSRRHVVEIHTKSHAHNIKYMNITRWRVEMALVRRETVRTFDLSAKRMHHTCRQVNMCP